MEWKLRNLDLAQITQILRRFDGVYLTEFANCLEELEAHVEAQERMRLAHINAMSAAENANAEDVASGHPEMAAHGELLPYQDFVQKMEYHSHSGKRYIVEAGCGETLDGQYYFTFSLDSSIAADFFEIAEQPEKAKIQKNYYEAVMGWIYGS